MSYLVLIQDGHQGSTGAPMVYTIPCHGIYPTYHGAYRWGDKPLVVTVERLIVTVERLVVTVERVVGSKSCEGGSQSPSNTCVTPLRLFGKSE